MSLQHAHAHPEISHHGIVDGWKGRWYNRFFRPLAAGIYRRLAAEIDAGAPHGASVLDVGTGPAGLLLELARRRPDLALEGIDPSREMIRLAKSNIDSMSLAERVRVAVASGAALPHPDQSFDRVISTFSHHHWQDVETTVVEMARVLRPGGQIWIYDFRFVATDALVAALGASAGLAPPRRELRALVPWLPRLVARVEATMDDAR